MPPLLSFLHAIGMGWAGLHCAVSRLYVPLLIRNAMVRLLALSNIHCGISGACGAERREGASIFPSLPPSD